MIKEAVWKGNLGFMEFVKFKRVATPEQKEKFNYYLDHKQYDKLTDLIALVLGDRLDPSFYKGVVKESERNNVNYFAAFAVVIKNGKIAATTRDASDSAIGLPGGKIDIGEDIFQCARRESEEEGFKIYGDGKLIRSAIVDGKLVAWIQFSDAEILNNYKEKHRGIIPIWADVTQVSQYFGNSFLLNLNR